MAVPSEASSQGRLTTRMRSPSSRDRQCPRRACLCFSVSLTEREATLRAGDWRSPGRSAAASGTIREMLDIKIAGGVVVDGTGGAPRRADIGLTDDAIAAVGHLEQERAGRTIDATGLMVAPGFI